MRRLLLLAALVAACKRGDSKPTPAELFREERTEAIELDGFKIAIPPGYRAAADFRLGANGAKASDAAPTDSRVAVPEQEPDLLWVAAKAYASDLVADEAGCAKMAALLNADHDRIYTLRGVRPTKVGPACEFKKRDRVSEADRDIGVAASPDWIYFELPHGGRALMLICAPFVAEDQGKADAACKLFLDAVASS